VEGGDPATFSEFFGRVAEIYRPYRGQAETETDALIEFMAGMK